FTPNHSLPCLLSHLKPDLMCSELFEEDDLTSSDSSKCSSASSSDDSSYHYTRNDSPLSAVDIFTEFDRGVLQAVLESEDNANNPGGASSTSNESPLSILVS
ncbi:G1/S-specific cyclin-D2, partial [Caligus rogercresseyi]